MLVTLDEKDNLKWNGVSLADTVRFVFNDDELPMWFNACFHQIYQTLQML